MVKQKKLEFYQVCISLAVTMPGNKSDLLVVESLCLSQKTVANLKKRVLSKK